MKTADAFWQFLPEGLDELFEMVKFEKTDQSYDIWLDEKKKLHLTFEKGPRYSI